MNIIEKDLFRYYGRIKKTNKMIYKSNIIKFIILFRKGQNTKSKVMKKIYKYRLVLHSQKSNINIPINTKIGEGFYIGHGGPITINEKVIIGKNVNVASGVTIGQESRGERKGTPIISDNVWIGTNSVVVGKVKIGTNVLIAPLSFVNFDVPDNSIVVGNPAKIIQSNKATDGYIVNKI